MTKHEFCVATIDKITELPFTLYDKRIRADFVVLGYKIGNSLVQRNNWCVETEDGKLTIKGNISGETWIQLALGTVEEFEKMLAEIKSTDTIDNMVFISRYIPGLENGKGVHFEIGETVKYRMRNGEEHEITIDSERMAHQDIDLLGYEAIFDDGVRAFAVEDGIYDWKGKKQ